MPRVLPMAVINESDDLNWLFTTHIKGSVDRRELVRSACVYGNQDCPSRVELYERSEPYITDLPLAVYESNHDGTLVKIK